MDYKLKYLKYKNKYLNLKNQIGGVHPNIDLFIINLKKSIGTSIVWTKYVYTESYCIIKCVI